MPSFFDTPQSKAKRACRLFSVVFKAPDACCINPPGSYKTVLQVAWCLGSGVLEHHLGDVLSLAPVPAGRLDEAHPLQFGHGPADQGAGV